MFDFLKKGKKDDPLPPQDQLTAPGWQAIEKAFEQIYPGQKPKHWAHGGIRRMHDRNTPPANPLEGVNVYDAQNFWHYVSLGMSDLYGKGSSTLIDGDMSGFGFEFTFRLTKYASEFDGQRRRPADSWQDAPFWPIDLMVSLARAAYTGKYFAPKDIVKTGPIDGREKTKLTALLFVQDPAFQLQQTPYGKFGFLQIVPVESDSYERAMQGGFQQVIDELLERDKNLACRYEP